MLRYSNLIYSVEFEHFSGVNSEHTFDSTEHWLLLSFMHVKWICKVNLFPMSENSTGERFVQFYDIPF